MKGKVETISELRSAIVQSCCKKAEIALVGEASGWDTFEPRFQTKLFASIPELAKECLPTDWDVAHSLLPSCQLCELDTDRSINKEGQLRGLLKTIVPVVDEIHRQVNRQGETVKVVEFGAGSGHLGLLLAALRADSCHVTLLERKEYACQQARERAREAKLHNVTVVHSSIHEFANFSTDQGRIVDHAPSFQLGISLHSCGVLTDAALSLCLRQSAAFVLVPCCYGQTAANLPPEYLPRNPLLECLREVGPPHDFPEWKDCLKESSTSKDRRKQRKLQNCKQFDLIASLADCTSAVQHNAAFLSSQNFVIAKRCMQIVDADRLLWVREHGYTVRMSSLQPLSLTPKNNVIIGRPEEYGIIDENVNLVPFVASAAENKSAEAGERRRTGRNSFQDIERVRRIDRFSDEEIVLTTNAVGQLENFPCAFHIQHAFSKSDLRKLDELRRKIPLDVSRPTCPRRFLTEKSTDDDNKHHREDGWVGDMIDAAVESWGLPFGLVSLPWYRFLEYTEPGGHMDKHTDGSNLHPTKGDRSVATMLIYLSTCKEGGETTLYRGKRKGPKSKSPPENPVGDVIESIKPVYNTALIFPHGWQHSGDPVIRDPKIALRVDLTWKR